MLSHISRTKCSKSCALSRLASNLSHSELLITQRSRLETWNEPDLSSDLNTKKIGLFHFDFMRERHDINTSDFNFITFLRFSQLCLGNSILINFFSLNIKHFPCFNWNNRYHRKCLRFSLLQVNTRLDGYFDGPLNL